MNTQIVKRQNRLIEAHKRAERLGDSKLMKSIEKMLESLALEALKS
jgi:hypothetical protein